MSDKPVLRVDWCGYDAAEYAVKHWHYSGCMPSGKLSLVGAWENDVYIGCVMFGRGANNNIGSPYKLSQTEVCELVRIALNKHLTPVSKIASIAIKFLKSHSVGIRLIVSYANPIQGHHGGIYQAMNWVYVGASRAQRALLHAGRVMHKRTANALFGTIKGMEKSPVMWKHKYLMPLDDAMRKQIAPLAKPYPKRQSCVSSIGSDATGDQPEEGGAAPTDTLTKTSETKSNL